MLVEKNVPLQPYNTFHIVAKAFSLVRVTGVDVLDQVLADPELAAYPYQFEVISLQDGVAEMSSPRSAQVPVSQFLRLVYPQLANTSVTDDAMMAAQDTLATLQSRAAKLVASQGDVNSVRWTLDREWYAYHGIYLD